MNIHRWLAVAGAAVLLASPHVIAAQAGVADAASIRDGLAKVESRHLDAFHALPGADFHGYTRVLLEPPQVALRGDWVKEINRSTRELSQRVTAEDAERIAAEARTSLGELLADAFKDAGYEIVAKPGAGVLRVSPRVVDLYVNAPDSVTTAPQNRVYTVDAGKATLVLEFRDSASGALLGRATDHGTASISGSSRLTRTSSIASRREFDDLFRAWARASVEALAELKARPPVAITGQQSKP